MVNRRVIVGAAIAAAGLLPTRLMAAIGSEFSPAAFEAAQAAGKSIIVAVHAPWCPTCRVQEPILKKLLGEAKYRDVVVFNVDFDSQKETLRLLKATKQSTLIAFKGKTEMKRSTGDTESMSIEDLVESAL